MEAGVVTGTGIEEVAHPRAAGYAGAHPRSEQRTIGWLFGCTGIALFALMGILGLLMRFDQARVIDVGPSFFYRIMTMHGAGMIVGTLLAMMGGVWFAVRETVQLEFRRVLVSYALVVVGAVMVLVAVMVGKFATGWTFLFPLPFNAKGEWQTWAAVLYVLGIGGLALGFLVFCVDMVVKIIGTYGGIQRAMGISFLRGQDDDPPPPPAIAALVVGIQGMIATGGGVAIVIALLTNAFDGTTSLNALWAKELTYSYGHTLANLIIYLAAGMLYMLVPRYAGRPWKTTKPIVIGWMATLIIVLVAYPHHLYMDFAQPVWASVIAMVASSAAAIPVAVVTIYTAMMLVWGSKYRWTLASTLLYLGFAGWAIGGTGAVIDSLIPVNFRFHNTLWVPAHFHTYMMLGVALWTLSFVAYLLERAAGEPSSRFANVAAPVALMAGGYGLVGVWYISGALGVPRRYAVHFGDVTSWSVAAAIAATIFAIGVLIVLAEYLRLARLARLALARGGFREALATASGGADSADGAIEPAAGVPRPLAAIGSMLTTTRQLTICVAAATIALVSLSPTFDDAVKVDAQLHHLVHSGQFLYGMLLAVAVACTPVFAARLTWRHQNSALAAVILAPAVMLALMAPGIYTSLDSDSFVHALYHLVIVALGLLTGFALTAFDRFTAWLLFALTASMGVVYAAGVGLL